MSRKDWLEGTARVVLLLGALARQFGKLELGKLDLPLGQIELQWRRLWRCYGGFAAHHPLQKRQDPPTPIGAGGLCMSDDPYRSRLAD